MGLTVNCAYSKLDDWQLSNILDVFLFSPNVSPVIELYASHNSLTKVPHQIPKFAALKEIKLGHNEITEIPSTALDSNSATANYYIELDHNYTMWFLDFLKNRFLII